MLHLLKFMTNKTNGAFASIKNIPQGQTNVKFIVNTTNMVYRSSIQSHHHNQTMELIRASPLNTTHDNANIGLQPNPTN
jgi:hypothetical protein